MTFRHGALKGGLRLSLDILENSAFSVQGCRDSIAALSLQRIALTIIYPQITCCAGSTVISNSTAYENG